MLHKLIALVSSDHSDQERFKRAMTSNRAVPIRSEFQGINAFCSDASVELTLGRQGFVFGPLFRRNSVFSTVTQIDDGAAAEIIRTAGGNLCHNFWGGYVAAWSQPEGGWLVSRDPSGAMPCFYARLGAGTLIFTDIDLALQAGLPRPAVDWAALANCLSSVGLPTEATALVGVTELMPGFSLAISASRTEVRAYWSPWDHVNRPLGDDGQAQEALRRTVDGCVGAWASRHKRILLTASGGLDSSIVAAALSRQPNRFELLTKSSFSPSGDEREYARIVAEHVATTLHEELYDHAHIDVTRADTNLPRPWGAAFVQSNAEIVKACCERNDLDAEFTGFGGDSVFCAMSSATPIVDRYRSGARYREVRQTFDDVCALTGCTGLQAGWMALKRAMRTSPQYRWRVQDLFLSKRAWNHPSHPWMIPPKGSLPGKAVHIAHLLQPMGAFDWGHRDGGPGQVHPLLSQPIVELCLAIPTWKWVSGGRERSMARSAFADRLPASILGRRTKGIQDAFYMDVVDRNRALYRAYLVGGVLHEYGIVDGDAVAAALSDPRPVAPPAHTRLSILMNAEIWARAWQ